MRIAACLTLCALLFLPRVAEAAPLIRDIIVEGNYSVSTESIRSVIISRPGMPLSEERVARDIRALHELDRFSHIVVRKRTVPGGVALVYIVEETPKVGAIEFKGNKKLDDDELEAVLTIRPLETADLSDINESIQKMKQEYADKGYHLVNIRYSFEPMKDSPDKKLVFTIQEQQGIRIKKVNFIGNKAFSDKELRKVIQTKAKGLLSWLTGSGKYTQETLERDTAFLTYHYLNHGYLRVKVSAPESYLTRDRQWLIVNFHIDEGKQYRIGSVNIVGDILTTKGQMLDMMQTKPGEIYSRRKLDEDVQKLTEMYGDEAYAFASINPVTQADDENLTADITFQILKGQKIKIEKINIIGNTVTRDKVIRREMQVVENGYYNETRLRKSRERLMALGFFEEVNFATPRGSTDDQLVLNVRVKEKATGTFSIGAGFSSVENFILTASIAKENFLGYGISGRFSLELSSRRQLFLLSYQDPYFLDTNWIFALSGFRTVNVFEDFDRSSFGGSMSFGRRIFEKSQILLGYEIEDVEATDFSTTIPEPFDQNLSGLTSAASLSLIRDTRNNRLFPTKGTYVSAVNEFAGLGGDNDFYRVIGNARYYRNLFWKVIFKANATIGYINSLNDLPVPLFERFFTGGVNSLRGFELRSVGPSVQVVDIPSGEDTRFVIGGDKLLIFNVEFELPLYQPAGVNLVAFYDAGNAYGEDQTYDLTNMLHDYGFGLRWNSPFGPMRFEWGFPINKRPGDDSVIFNFTIGSFF